MALAKKHHNLQREFSIGNSKLVDQNVSYHLNCPICCGIFMDPVKVSCGHTFCEKCVVIYQDSEKTARVILRTCPLAGCNETLQYQRFQRDILASNLINDLEIYCENSDCRWQGQYGSYLKHKKDCSSGVSFIGQVLPEDHDIQEIKRELKDAEREDTIQNRKLQEEFDHQSREINKEWEVLNAAKEDPAARMTIEELISKFPEPKRFMKKFPAYIFKQIERIQGNNPELLAQMESMLQERGTIDGSQPKETQIKNSHVNREPRTKPNSQNQEEMEEQSERKIPPQRTRRNR